MWFRVLLMVIIELIAQFQICIFLDFAEMINSYILNLSLNPIKIRNNK